MAASVAVDLIRLHATMRQAPHSRKSASIRTQIIFTMLQLGELHFYCFYSHGKRREREIDKNPLVISI